MICIVDGCQERTKAKNPKRGFCHRHYMRWWHHGDPTFHRFAYLRADRASIRDDILWVAGFLEGEGCFGMNSPTARCATISAAQVDKEPLARLRTFLGGSIRSKNGRGKNHSDHYVWQISGKRARGVMMTLYSLLSTRRKEAVRKALAV